MRHALMVAVVLDIRGRRANMYVELGVRDQRGSSQLGARRLEASAGASASIWRE